MMDSVKAVDADRLGCRQFR